MTHKSYLLTKNSQLAKHGDRNSSRDNEKSNLVDESETARLLRKPNKLPPLSVMNNDLATKLADHWKRENISINPSFNRALIFTIGWKIFLIGLMLIPMEIAKLAQPILLIRLLEFFNPCSRATLHETVVEFVFILCAALIASVFYHTYFYLGKQFAFNVQNACSLLIYDKILRCSNESISKEGTGKMNNLLSNDIGQIYMLLLFVNYIWVVPLMLIVTTLLFFHYGGYVAFVPIGYTIILLIVQIFSGRLRTSTREKIIKKTDERTKLITEMLKSLQTIRLYCWTKFFENRINEARQVELNQYRYRLIIMSFQKLFSQTYISLSFLLIYVFLRLLSIPFDMRFFAAVSCMLVYMRLTAIDFLNYAIESVIKWRVSSERIQKFLMVEEKSNTESATDVSTSSTEYSIDCRINKAAWKKDDSFSLQNITFQAKPSDLVCVVGRVGSGKSTLLKTLLREVNHIDGEIKLSGSICYLQQDPWLISTTVKDNICFGMTFDQEKFDNIVRNVVLTEDIRSFPDGIHTYVGDAGSTLSGGQKQRVCWARGLYRNASIYLLDDSFSAVDPNVAQQLYKNVSEGRSHGKTYILITNKMEFIKEATHILVMNQGRVEHSGSFDNLNRDGVFNQFYDLSNAREIENELQINNKDKATSKASTSQPNKPVTATERTREGRISWQTYGIYLKGKWSLFSVLLLLLILFVGQQSISLLSNWWIGSMSEDETLYYRLGNNCSHTVTMRKNYLLNMNETTWTNYRNRNFYVYCCIMLALVCSTIFRAVGGELIFINSAKFLHEKMLHQVMRSPMSFFNSKPIGETLNRFIKDISLIDDYLANIFFDFLYCLFQVIGAFVLVSSLNPWALMPAIIASLVMLYIRHRFASSLRDIKRSESKSRSPIFTHLISTIKGLAMIRSMDAQQFSMNEYGSILKENLSLKRKQATIEHRIGFYLDLITVFFIFSVITLAILVHIRYHEFSPISVALTLSYSLNLIGLLQWTIQQSLEIANQMTAVERVLEYCEIDQEQSILSQREDPLPEDWPSNGSIVFDKVFIKYGKQTKDPFILENINFTTNPNEKLAIMGRTGSGKTSMIQLLFRMYPITNGQIIIDGIDIGTIDVDHLRRRMAIIPQDPILFKGTIRFNLDPSGEYEDSQIWCTLKQVKLDDWDQSILKHGLDSSIDENGSNLSIGQKQLICIARALLKSSKIIVFDEATANIEDETDQKIRDTLKEICENCTVIKIAHRIQTVSDCDRILVLHHGQIIESGQPANLLQDDSSHLSKLLINN